MSLVSQARQLKVPRLSNQVPRLSILHSLSVVYILQIILCIISSLVVVMHTLSPGLNNQCRAPRVEDWFIHYSGLESGLDNPRHLIIRACYPGLETITHTLFLKVNFCIVIHILVYSNHILKRVVVILHNYKYFLESISLICHTSYDKFIQPYNVFLRIFFHAQHSFGHVL